MPQKTRQTKVWDVATRIFHWALAATVAMSFISIEILHDIELHVRCGAIALGLLTFRLLWGFFGSATARFTTFITSPGSVVRYIRSPRPEKARHVGHSPLAGVAVIIMLLSLSTQVATGLYSDDQIYTTGPLAGTVSSSASELATEVHYANSDFLLALIALHLLANAYYALVMRINLVRPMVTGQKPLTNVGPVRERPISALLCAAISIAVCLYIFN